MPLEHLLSALEREAQAQSEALLAAARAEAAEISRRSEELVARQRADVLRTREGELRGAAEATVGEARRAARATVLTARQQLIDRVFERAREMLPGASAGEAYRAVLPQHIAEALAALGDQPAVIRCDAGVADAVRSAVARKEHLVVRPEAGARAGVVVATTDGTIEVDNTLDGRLERVRAQLALEVMARVAAP